MQVEMRQRHFSPCEKKKLASATALSSFMVRRIRCQTHVSKGAPPSPPEPADWACSHLHHVIWCSSRGPRQRCPHMDSKHFTVYLITIQIVPVLVWITDFFFVFSQWSPPCAYDVSMRLGALDQVGQPVSLWGLPIKVESKGNSMPPADSDWW